MISFDGYRAIDLSPRIKARVHRVDGSIEEGTSDPYGKPWVMQEGRFPGDNSLFTLYSAPKDDAVWHQERMTSHHGAHVQGGKGHIDHWPGMPEEMRGLWEMPQWSTSTILSLGRMTILSVTLLVRASR